MNSENIVSAVFGSILKVVFAIAVIFLIYRAAATCYDYGYRIFTEPAVSSGEGRSVTVTVTEDMSAQDIGKLFQEKGLVKNSRLFALQYLFSEYKEDVKPGTFTLSTAMTAEEMMAVMADEQAADTATQEGDTSESSSEDTVNPLLEDAQVLPQDGEGEPGAEE